MQKDFGNSGNSPLQGENDLDNFFMDGGRAEVLARLQESIDVGIPLLLVTGEEGSGKTMLCRMLEQRMPEKYTVVHFKHPVESFEDVVRVIADELGVGAAGMVNGEAVKDAIEQIMSFLLEDNCHLLLIFDEAEIIYLATLERIRKMLEKMTEEGVNLHVLFSGRPSFLENYEQLIICGFKQIEEVHLGLKPLTEGETADYLAGCIQRLSDSEERDVFTHEVILKICAVAQGNFKKVNALVRESILTRGDDSSFMVLLDSVADEREEKKKGREWLQAVTNIKRFIPSITWVGGAAAFIFVMLLVFGSLGTKERETIEPLKEVKISEQVIIDVEKEKTVETEPVVEDKVPAVEAIASDEVVPAEVVFVEVSEQPVIEKVSSPEIIQEEAVSGDEEIVPQETVKLEYVQVEPVLLEDTQPEIKKTVVETPEVAITEREKVVEISPPKEDVIVELRPSPSLKKKVGVYMPLIKRKVLAASGSKASKVNPVDPHLTINQLYARRMAAGREWERGTRNSMYTIQLMVLTSENAEENFKKMLAKENYRQQAANFFILNKPGSPAVMVYYGEYPTIAKARREQNSMPSFLLNHKPYAMSIKSAVDKLRY